MRKVWNCVVRKPASMRAWKEAYVQRVTKGKGVTHNIILDPINRWVKIPLLLHTSIMPMPFLIKMNLTKIVLHPPHFQHTHLLERPASKLRSELLIRCLDIGFRVRSFDFCVKPFIF